MQSIRNKFNKRLHRTNFTVTFCAKKTHKIRHQNLLGEPGVKSP